MKRLGIIIVVVLLAAAGYFGYSQFKASKTANPTNMATEGTKTAVDTVRGTIQGLIAGGKNVTCTVVDKTRGTGSSTIFVSGKKMAGDFKNVVEGKTIEGHMLMDGTFAYIWSSDQPDKGIKISVDEVNKADKQQGVNQGLDINAETELKCSPWIPNGSKFIPPTNIKFTDLTEMMKGFTQPKTTTETTPTSTDKAAAPQTSVCDQITDATAKEACVKALQDQGQ
jgi:hypothetical protein